MGRKPKRIAEPLKEKSSNFLEALKFLSLITKNIGTPNETHVWLGHQWAMTSNGVLTAACKIEEDIYACPHNTTLIEALSKCGQHMSITQTSNFALSIKSDKFKVLVPCMDQTLYQMSGPDPITAVITNQLKEAFEAVSVLSSNDAQQVVIASILINRGSVISSNGKMIFEYWHGLDLPVNLAVPKAFADVLIKLSKKLTGFGYSSNSVTIYFEDESWLKTQLFADEWPDISKVLNKTSNPFTVPGEFFKAVAAVAPFSPDGLIHSEPGVLLSHRTANAGASYELEGVPPGLTFSAKQLGLIKNHAETIDFVAPGPHEGTTCLMFFGKNIRGAIAGHAR